MDRAKPVSFRCASCDTCEGHPTPPRDVERSRHEVSLRGLIDDASRIVAQAQHAGSLGLYPRQMPTGPARPAHENPSCASRSGDSGLGVLPAMDACRIACERSGAVYECCCRAVCIFRYGTDAGARVTSDNGASAKQVANEEWSTGNPQGHYGRYSRGIAEHDGADRPAKCRTCSLHDDGGLLRLNRYAWYGYL